MPPPTAPRPLRPDLWEWSTRRRPCFSRTGRQDEPERIRGGRRGGERAAGPRTGRASAFFPLSQWTSRGWTPLPSLPRRYTNKPDDAAGKFSIADEGDRNMWSKVFLAAAVCAGLAACFGSAGTRAAEPADGKVPLFEGLGSHGRQVT